MNAPSIDPALASDPVSGPPSVLPSGLPSDLPGDLALDPVHEPMWRQLGADHARAVLLRLPTLAVLHARWMRDGGVSAGVLETQALEPMLPGAEHLLPDWVLHTALDPVPVIAHMLSPRRWVYFWRVDDQHGMLVLIHFLTGRNSAHEFDTGAVRVLCEHWLGTELARLTSGGPSQPTWDRVERRREPRSAHGVQAALAGLVVSGLFGVWLAVFGASSLADRIDSQQRTTARLVALSNNSLHSHLSHALASTDYGQVQEVLALHKSLDHFAAAGVANARGLVVAHVGFTPGLVIGAPPPAELRQRAQRLPLAVGSTALGEVLMVAGPAEGADASSMAPWRAAGLLLTALAAAAGWLLWREIRRPPG